MMGEQVGVNGVSGFVVVWLVKCRTKHVNSELNAATLELRV